ncbi:MAG: hypothetical protein M0Q49_03245 [Porticoccaceae bacterium]|nr:hypothetical protein [Porticoccaceae bacterium]
MVMQFPQVSDMQRHIISPHIGRWVSHPGTWYLNQWNGQEIVKNSALDAATEEDVFNNTGANFAAGMRGVTTLSGTRLSISTPSTQAIISSRVLDWPSVHNLAPANQFGGLAVDVGSDGENPVVSRVSSTAPFTPTAGQLFRARFGRPPSKIVYDGLMRRTNITYNVNRWQGISAIGSTIQSASNANVIVGFRYVSATEIAVLVAGNVVGSLTGLTAGLWHYFKATIDLIAETVTTQLGAQTPVVTSMTLPNSIWTWDVVCNATSGTGGSPTVGPISIRYE